jgi:ABC transporter substrate binding protein
LLSGPILFVEREKIIQLATKNRLPAMYSAEEFVEHGGLMSYAANVTDLWRRAAAYVDKILTGAKHGPPRRATDKVRVGDQLENRQADRTHDSTQRAGKSRQSHQMKIGNTPDPSPGSRQQSESCALELACLHGSFCG